MHATGEYQRYADVYACRLSVHVYQRFKRRFHCYLYALRRHGECARHVERNPHFEFLGTLSVTCCQLHVPSKYCYVGGSVRGFCECDSDPGTQCIWTDRSGRGCDRGIEEIAWASEILTGAMWQRNLVAAPCFAFLKLAGAHNSTPRAMDSPRPTAPSKNLPCHHQSPSRRKRLYPPAVRRLG